MSAILVVSILIRIIALVWSLVVLKRLNDRRILFLTTMLVLMTVRQILTLASGLSAGDFVSLNIASHPDELPGLIVSVMALLVVMNLESMSNRVSDGLQQSERRFRSVIENSFDVITMFSQSAQISYVSPSSVQVLGYQPEELIGRPGNDFVHPEDVEIANEAFGRALAQPGERVHLTHRLRHRDGSYRTMEVTGINLLDLPGVESLVTNCRDVTGQRRAEQELVASRQRLQLALDSARAGTFDWDVQTGLVEWSAGHFRLHGYDIGEIQPTYDVWASRVHADDRRAVERRIRQAQDDRTDYTGEYRVIWPDGSTRWIEGRGRFVYDDSGDATRMYGVVIDINDRKRAELDVRLRDHALAASSNGIVIVDAMQEGRPIVYCNPAFERLTGYSRDEVLGRNCRFLQGEDRDQPGRHAIRNAIEQGHEVTATLRNFRKDEAMFWNEIRISPVRDAAGHVTHFIGFQYDVTARTQSEEALRASEQRFRIVFENAPIGIAVSDADGSPLAYNHRFQQMLGYSDAELCSMDLTEFTVEACVDDNRRLIDDVRTGRQIVGRMEKQYRRRDGSSFWADLSVCAAHDDSGEVQMLVGMAVDIDERKQAEQKLLIRQRAIESSVTPTAFGDEYHVITSANRAFLDLFGFESEDQVIGMPNTSFVSEPTPIEEINAVLNRTGSWSGETATRRVDGTSMDVLLRTSLLRDESGQPLCSLVTLVDITARKEAENALRKSEQQFRELTESVPLALSIVQYGRPVYVNRWAGQITGFEREELLALEAGSLVHPDFSEAVRDLVADCQEHGTASRTEMKIIHKGGTEKWVDCSMMPFEHAGSPAVLVGSIDITDRKHAEQQLLESERRNRGILESSIGGIYIYDLQQGRNIYINRQYTVLTGYSLDQISEMTADEFFALFHPDDQPQIEIHMQEIQQALCDGATLQIDYRFKAADGDWHWYSSSDAVFERDGSGQARQFIGTFIDITQRKKTEESLRSREEQLRLALSAANMGVFDMNLVTDDGSWSDSMGPVYGLPSGWQMSKDATILTMIHPDDRDEEVRRFERAIENSDPYANEFRVYWPDGTEHWVARMGRVLGDDLTGPRRMIGVAWDITDRKQADRQLRESEEQFRTLAENSPVMVSIFRGETRLYTNRASEELTGFTREELLTMRPGDNVHPDDRALVVDRSRRQQAGESVLERYEFRLVTRADEIRWVDSAAAMIDYGGQPAVLCTALDITDRKETEEALQVRAQQQAAAVVLARAALSVGLEELFARATLVVAETLDVELSKVLQLLPCGDSLRLVAGVGWPDGLVGQAEVSAGLESQAGYTLLSDSSVIVEDLPRESRFTGPSLLIEHAVVSGLSVVIHGTDGPWGVLGAHSQSHRRFSEDDVRFFELIAGVLSAAIERSAVERALRHSERELSELNESLELRVHQRTAELEETNAELEAFAYSVSHDLRTPLRAMEGFASALAEDYGEQLDDNGRLYIHQIAEAASRMDVLVDDLLAYSRLGRTELRLQPVELQSVVDQVLLQLEPERQERGARIEIAENLPRVLGQRAILQLVFSNLLSNAMKFVAHGVQPEIRLWSESRPDGKVRIWCEDNGIGIDRAHTDGIFDVFARLHGIESYPGTGIGLAIVRRASERLGGGCGVESQPGLGSRFWVELPEARRVGK